MTGYYDRLVVPVGAGLLFLALLMVVGWWSARRQPEHMAAVIWACLGALAVLGLNQVLVRLLARPRPYNVLSGVEVLVPRVHGYGTPSAHAAIAGAVVCGLMLARRWRLAGLAFLAALLLGFADVYVGADYPSAVAGGAISARWSCYFFGPSCRGYWWRLSSGSARAPLVDWSQRGGR